MAQIVRDWPNLHFKIAFVDCGKQTRLIKKDVCVLGQYGVAENTPGRFPQTAQKVRAIPNLRFKIAFVHCGKETRLINRDYVCCLKILCDAGLTKKNLAHFLERPK